MCARVQIAAFSRQVFACLLSNPSQTFLVRLLSPASACERRASVGRTIFCSLAERNRQIDVSVNVKMSVVLVDVYVCDSTIQHHLAPRHLVSSRPHGVRRALGQGGACALGGVCAVGKLRESAGCRCILLATHIECSMSHPAWTFERSNSLLRKHLLSSLCYAASQDYQVSYSSYE